MYKLHRNSFGVINSVFRVADNAQIPFDEANTDYQAYLKWLEEGGVVLPAETN